MVAAGLLLLADARLPAGGHVHSGSVEAAVRAGAVTDVPSLHGFLRGRLVSAGLVAAAFAAAATRLAESLDGGDAACWAELDAELDARTPAAGQRLASRQQGRGLLRALPRHPAGGAAAGPGGAGSIGGAAGPSAEEVDAAAVLAALRAGCPAGAHHPLAFGAGAAMLGASAEDAAVAIALAAVTGPASAAIRLLAFDPFAVQSVLNSLSSTVDSVAAAAAIPVPWNELPAEGAPALDVLADTHPTLTDTLFVS
ncbi:MULTISPECIES: urease accessory protein UreF [unclassified Crossiella]|uniref:urease accessory protein UreF n=1 Tax=unclassified Crossiella TaxID=2620835 RepID=UPI001FFEB13A|nr:MULTISPECIES: urease accessory UreF family protein [unclassified Crossiella]MCK2243300.1 urease accessory protein UreF [Crossiella sp. S99.2]MCK2254231.1 urease accessory protein UreF [Crossiella sp. S99.1]